MKRFPPLFRNLPKEFFRVLALGNVEESYRLIALIDDYFGPLRYDVGREELASYLAEQMKKDVIDDFEVEAKTPLEKARSFLRRLVEYGWLDKEEGEGFSDRLSRSDAFMKTVPVLLEIAEEEERTTVRNYKHIVASYKSYSSLLRPVSFTNRGGIGTWA